MRRLLLAPALLVAGCAYYNGIYNARAAERLGDREAGRGNPRAAAAAWRQAAASAETVLVRFPRSRWRADALYLAGRGAALAGRCEAGAPRLEEFLRVSPRRDERLARASLALAACRLYAGRGVEAAALAEPWMASRDERIARDAALWAARAAVANGDIPRAAAHLARVSEATREWELARAWLGRGEHARAESLLARRAERGDLREETLSMLDTLWLAGRTDAVIALADRYAHARADGPLLARVHLAVASGLLQRRAASEDSLAALHLAAAARLPADSAVRRDIAARTAILALRAAPTVADAERVVATARSAARGSSVVPPLERALFLLRLLEGRADLSGASLFLAAELARDSLGAPVLAHRLFRRVAERAPETLMAPKALLAAAALRPDSAETYRQHVRRRYPATPFAAAATGTRPAAADAAEVRTTDALLRRTWQEVMAALPDSLRAPRAAAPPPRPSAGARP